ncbi:MAG: aminotransferase [Pseudolysinimonas sp.]|uniref:aminotransferase n=1 Tax=Pseudolysinimonas sp. TaxID=2680009 RepID=UPI003C7386A3
MTIFDFFARPALARPEVDAAAALRVADGHYGVTGDVAELGSNQDRNFHVAASDRRVLLKFSNAAFGRAELEAQNLAAAAVAAAGIRAPQCLPALDGQTVLAVDSPGGPLRVRMLEYVEGEPLSGAGAFVTADARRLGALSARVALALAPLRHPGLAQRTQWNLRDAALTVRLLAGAIPDAERRRRVTTVAEAAARALDPLRADLRTQAIHGDLTDDNIVVGASDGEWGVIDFGDVAESWLVAELAVTCAAVLHHNPRDPLVILEAIAAFHDVLPLADAELDALWPLIQLRAATLVASGEHQVALEADNRYAAQNRLQEWRSFAVAADLDVNAMTALIHWRVGGRTDPLELGAPVALLADASSAVVLDLSTTSRDLDGGVWLEPDAERRLAAAHQLSVTAWGEPRLTRAVVRSRRHTSTVPLGIQLSSADALAVTAPADGTLRRVGDSTVLETAGYDLWIDGLHNGSSGAVAAGTPLGTLAPHPARLSVQISRARGGRLPFFVPPALAEVGKLVSPDPAPLLGLTSRLGEPEPAEVLATRDAHFATVQEHYFAEPPLIERGWREHFVDTQAQTYVDMVNNVATAGHAHPRIVAAASRQWALHNTNSRFHYSAVAEFSRRLSELAPASLDAVFLVNSGSEAVDLALRLATVTTGHDTIVAMREAYHGWTVGSDAVSSSIGDNPRALETRPSWVRLVNAPNTYRGTHRGPDAGPRYLADLDADFARWDAEGLSIAGFIAEPVYGNAGGVMLPDGYLAGAYGMVRERGGLCIADEVQVGYGRLGSYFWGHEQQDAVPDVITIAKAMGNGQPLGAVLTTRAIAEAFAVEGSMFSSAGGSPVSCVIGSTVLDIMRDEALVDNARDVGGHLKSRLEDLGRRHPLIGAVHGLGLYLGVELVRSPETLEPATAEAYAVCEALLEEGCIVQPTGDHHNVLKIKPPLVITRESVDYFVDALDRVLGGIPLG